jgi:hypothetical protein
MKHALGLFFSLIFLSTIAMAGEASRADNFICKVLEPADGNSVHASELQAALTKNCDLTKPFSSSVVDGSNSYAAQMLYCCTTK